MRSIVNKSAVSFVKCACPGRVFIRRAAARTAAEAARRALGVLRLMVGWAIEERLVNREDNPASQMERPPTQEAEGRSGALIDEVRAVWRAADSGFAFDNHARLMLLTGCRAGELARARWPWVDLNQGLLSIPASEYKTNRPHVVRLVPQAVAILENSFRGGRGDYVLSTTGGEKPIRGLAKFYQARLPSAILTKHGGALSAPFTSHDLRRSAVTHIAKSLGIGGEPLIKRLLGHADNSVTSIYNRYGYLKEMRAALEAWARELTQ